MMSPGTDEVLDAIVATVENEIAPHVTDPLASSLCRTVAQMLRSVRARLDNELPALQKDNAALRVLLSTWSLELPTDVADTANAALAQRPEPVYPTLAEMNADAGRLRGALAEAIESIPDSDHPFRRATRSYLTGQLEHEKVWMQDAFTGPRR